MESTAMVRIRECKTNWVKEINLFQRKFKLSLPYQVYIIFKNLSQNNTN